jgi:cell division protease FtsH
VVVNKEFAEIHIKKDRLGDQRHKQVSEKLFRAEESPLYRITIGSVETFEDKLQRAQEGFSPSEKIRVQYETRTSWIGILSWLLPFGIIILFWMFMLRRMGGKGTGGNPLFNFGKSTPHISEKGTKSSASFEDIAGLK